jgi:hypothetical protein
MKKILSLALGMTFVLGMVAFAQDSSSTPPPDSSKSGKKSKKNKKSKSDTSGDKMEAPKQ